MLPNGLRLLFHQGHLIHQETRVSFWNQFPLFQQKMINCHRGDQGFAGPSGQTKNPIAVADCPKGCQLIPTRFNFAWPCVASGAARGRGAFGNHSVSVHVIFRDGLSDLGDAGVARRALRAQPLRVRPQIPAAPAGPLIAAVASVPKEIKDPGTNWLSENKPKSFKWIWVKMHGQQWT